MTVVPHILDTDLYKISMGYAVAKRYPHEEVQYKLFTRKNINFHSGFAELLKEHIQSLSHLTIDDKEKKFLFNKCSHFLDPFFIEWLNNYQFDPSEVNITQSGGDLDITIKGPWYKTIYWEIPILSMISELYYFHHQGCNKDYNEAREIDKAYERSKEKAKKLSDEGIKFADFGTRRRFSYQTHRAVIQGLIDGSHHDRFVGTSNIHLAQQFNLTPIGTQAHEFIMFHAAKYGFKSANNVALGRWVDIFNGELGISLTDTYTTDNFFENFDVFYAKLFDGLRHDSGDPFKFTSKAIQHYKSLGISPKQKTIIFSDSINTEKAIAIHRIYANQINVAFGIGTHFTNDLDYEPLDLVIKMTDAKINNRWTPVIKLSDEEGKHTGDSSTIAQAKTELGLT